MRSADSPSPAERAGAEDVADLVRRAGGGDRSAWDELVERYVGLIWSIAREHRLGEADAADVVQTTWLRLLEHINRLHDPAHVAAWLATTARRECLRQIAHRRRLVLVRDDDQLEHADVNGRDVDANLIRDEQGRAVREAIRQLPPRWQAMLELLVSDPAPSYEEISELLDVPIGSIGPTRGRSLQRLRGLLAE